MDEHVHLHAPNPLLVHLEAHLEWMAECDGRKTRQQIRVLGLVPVRRKLIRGADEQGTPLHCERLGGLEPGTIRLLRQHLARTLAQAVPEFGWRKRHQRGREAEERRGGEAIPSDVDKSIA